MATSNKIRALNRLPYDFQDGLKVGGVDVTNLNQAFTPAGAGLIGFTPVGNLSAGNVQAALAELDNEKVGFARLDDTDGSSLVGYGAGTVQSTLNTLTGTAGAANVGFTPTGSGVFSTTVNEVLDSMSVSVFRFMSPEQIADVKSGLATMDHAPAVRLAISHLFTTNKNTLVFPDGVYKFATPVVILFDTYRALRLIGTSSAGFTTARPGGSRITGAAGIEALFIFTKTTVTTWGGYAFECRNIDFDGAALGVGSAIVSKIGGAPARPFNVYNCNFRAFQKALYSDISATGMATGISQINIEGCNFQGNQYALYGKGQAAIQDLRFTGNVCEQNALGGICTEADALNGAVNISDNQLEGQPDALVLRGNLFTAEVKRNYFERNTGYVLLCSASNGRSRITVDSNYYTNCPGSKMFLGLIKFRMLDELLEAGISLDVTHFGLMRNRAKFVPETWSRTVFFELDSCQVGTNVNPGIVAGQYSGFKLSPTIPAETTPIGTSPIVRLTGLQVNTSTSLTLNAGDGVVAVCLFRTVSGNPTLGCNFYGSDNTYLTNSPAAGTFHAEQGKWYIAVAVCTVTTSAGTGVRPRWNVVGGTIDITQQYTYRVDQPVIGQTPVHLYLPYRSPIFGSVLYNPPSLADGEGVITTIAVTDAELGDFVESVSFSNDLQGVIATGWVSALGIVSVRLQNETGAAVDLTEGYLRVKVNKL